MKNTLAATLVAASALIVTAVQAATPEVEALLQAAQKEGAVYSVGMPNTWANWVKTWSDLQTKYKIKTQDTDMASAEQISKFMAEGENATSDIGDVGLNSVKSPRSAASRCRTSLRPGIRFQAGQKTRTVIGALPTPARWPLLSTRSL